jgi:hypothetical protein
MKGEPMSDYLSQPAGDRKKAATGDSQEGFQALLELYQAQEAEGEPVNPYETLPNADDLLAEAIESGADQELVSKIQSWLQSYKRKPDEEVMYDAGAMA